MARVRSAGGHRQRQAQATREAIAAAARRLFAVRGYVATTVEAIAEDADIPVPTIYSAFGAKPAILEEVRRLWVRDTAVAELHSEAMKLVDARARLSAAAHWTRRQFELGYDVIAVHQDAARADLRVAETWRLALAGRETAVSALLRPLSKEFKPGLSPTEALDLYVTLTVPEIYRTLVLERGWTVERYESWLAAALIRELLAVRSTA
jgi:AcrR family transcriptional regulator